MHRTYEIEGQATQHIDTWTARDNDAAVVTTFRWGTPYMRYVLRDVAADMLAQARRNGRITRRWSYDDNR